MLFTIRLQQNASKTWPIENIEAAGGGKPYREVPNEISVGFQGRSKETSKVTKNIVFLQSRLPKPLKIIVFFYFSVSNGIPRDSKASQSQARRDPEHMRSEFRITKIFAYVRSGLQENSAEANFEFDRVAPNHVKTDAFRTHVA